jgi:pimeloyl-ACP methyl ester carboxylesterase
VRPEGGNDGSIERAEPVKVVQNYWVTPGGVNLEVLSTNPAAGVGIAGCETIQEPKDLKWYEQASNMLWAKFISRKKSQEIATVAARGRRPPLLFVHGSYHGAWCWKEHFFDFFAARGHSCYAVSLRGTSGTGMPPDCTNDMVTIADHTADLSYALETLRRVEGADALPPVLVAHSFGGTSP